MVITAHFDGSPAETATARAPRRMLRLEAQGLTAAGAAARVLVHNISAGGLLLESEVPLSESERIDVELPEAGRIAARVVWASGSYFGCRFDAPISPAALSAAQLRGEAAGEGPRPLAVGGSFGARLQRLRKERGLTQANLATRLGVSKPTVWAWEQGKAKPVDSRIDALAAALDVAAADLFVEAEGAFLAELIARARAQIGSALGVGPDKIRITVDL